MDKINLHAHTQYSDGRNTIEELAIACQEMDFSACVITDHVLSNPHHRGSLSKEKYLQQKIEAEKISEQLHYPILLGIELSFCHCEEILVFGHEAILQIYDNFPNNNVSFLSQLREKYLCATILCHPTLNQDQNQVHDEIKDLKKPRFILIKGNEIIDGYEYYNNGQEIFKDQKVPEELSGLTRFSNSDAHNLTTLIWNYNLTERRITTEEELIKYIRNKEPIWMYSK